MKVKIICSSEEKYKSLEEELINTNLVVVNDKEDFVITESNYNKDSILGKIDDNYMIIKPDDILYVESFGHEVICHTLENNFLIREKLYEIEGLYQKYGLMRVHRSYVININYVIKISPSFNRKFVLTMKDGTKIDVSRSYFYKFKEYIGL